MSRKRKCEPKIRLKLWFNLAAWGITTMIPVAIGLRILEHNHWLDPVTAIATYMGSLFVSSLIWGDKIEESR